jgi:hypothetical protein
VRKADRPRRIIGFDEIRFLFKALVRLGCPMTKPGFDETWKNMDTLNVQIRVILIAAEFASATWNGEGLRKALEEGVKMSTKLVMTIIAAVLVSSSPGVLASSNEFVAHEWGTFTSISASNGATVEWTSYRGGAELPQFVYGSKINATGTVRMETPVIYFYSPRELTCKVKVSFPLGQITEYYPMVSQPDMRQARWDEVELLPGRAVNLPLEKAANHYYEARATESVPLRVWKRSVIDEYEKFLFYRGVGTFAMPLSIRVEADQLAVQSATPGIEEVILFEKRDGRTSCLRYDLQSSVGMVNRFLPDCSVASLKGDLEVLLATHGLYPKEAAAMVNTWEDSWFEEGFRLFYVLPRQQTDAILPLEITPKPDKLVRVLVGRMEIMTPETEQEILELLTRLKKVPGNQTAELFGARQRYGRFLPAMVRRILETHPSIWEPPLESALTSLGLPRWEVNLVQASR